MFPKLANCNPRFGEKLPVNLKFMESMAIFLQRCLIHGPFDLEYQ
jgi:hypothetical protein